MRIEITEQATPAFCREVVNVLTQSQQLLKKPDRRLRDNWRGMHVSLVLCAVLLLLNGAMALAWGPDQLTLAVTVLQVMGILLSGFYVVTMRRTHRLLMERDGGAVLTLDEDGVELDRIGVQRVRLDWSSVAFVRCFQESLCVMPKQPGMMMIAVDERYTAQVMEALRACGNPVPVH